MATMGQATLVNVSVFCSTTHQLLLPWRILEIGNPGRTIQQFYHDVAAPLIASSSQSRTKLNKAFLGHRKSDLDEVDMEILLEVAVATFGGYVRYITSRPMQKIRKGRNGSKCLSSDDVRSKEEKNFAICIQFET